MSIFQAPYLGILNGVFFGVPAGMVGISIANRNEITIADRLDWSWKKGGVGVLLGLIIGIIGGRIVAWIFPESHWFEVSVEIGLPFVLIFLISWGFTRKEALDRRVAPNQGMREAANMSLKVGVFAVSMFFIYALIVHIFWDESRVFGVFWAIEISLLIGVITGLVKNGAACIQHIVLRVILCLAGYIPWNFAQFLDEAVENIFLYRIGGGYIFIHRLLLDYFSSHETLALMQRRTT